MLAGQWASETASSL